MLVNSAGAARRYPPAELNAQAWHAAIDAKFFSYVHPLDIVFRLAEDHGIVLLNGSGFAAPDWSVRISFANLDDHVYDDIGRAVRAIARGYRRAYEASIGNGTKSANAKGR